MEAGEPDGHGRRCACVFGRSPDGVRVHALDNAGGGVGLTALAYVPGALAAAETFDDELVALLPRRAISVSLRGRGRSDAPIAGPYDFVSQVADLAAAIEAAALPQPVALMAHSMGVPVVLGYAVASPALVAGLVLIDYPPVYPPVDEAWAVQARADRPDMPRHVIDGIQRDAQPVVLSCELAGLSCPMLLIRGEHGLLPDDSLDVYAAAANLQVVTMPGAGHSPWDRDYDAFMAHVTAFLAHLDR